MLGHTKNLNKFKKVEITGSIFSDNNGIKTRNESQEKNKKAPKNMGAK